MVKKNPFFLASLVVLTTLTSCGFNHKIRDYELTPNVINLQGGAYYEVFIRTFADTNGDGVGDLNGVKEKLPYLKDLGVGGIWLMPIHPSPSYHGYDVEDYKAINAEYGNLANFDELVEAAHQQNIDIIIDLVLNHTSKTHPWFIEGFANFKSGHFSSEDNDNKANWYNFEWKNGVATYEARFGEWMPDLNLDNPKVREEIASIAKFWLDRGVKGFRLDAVTYFYTSSAKSVDFLGWFNDLVKDYKEDAFLVSEAYANEVDINAFYEATDTMFNFRGADTSGYTLSYIRQRSGWLFAGNVANAYKKVFNINVNARVASFLTNHDMNRSATMYGGMFTEERQKLAASAYLLTPGIPFMYYGEEIGLKGTRGTKDNTDANRRLPMIWQKNNDAWRTNPPEGANFPSEEQVEEGAYDLIKKPFSLVNHYKKVLNIRNQYPWLLDARVESVRFDDTAIGALKYTSQDGKELAYVLHNFSENDIEMDLRILNDDDTVRLEIIHDIFTVQKRAEYRQETKILLPRFSSVVIEER